ncbi:MAG: response regulator [Myxococcales bacterium]
MEWQKRASEWLTLRTQLARPGRALVVDDEEVMRDLFVGVLGTKFEVLAVGDAESALTLLREGPFDVLVTDKNLPGHDGVDLIAQARAEGFDVPAVLVTGYASLETVSRALSRGAADYIPKPFDDIRNVRRRIESVVEQHRTETLLARIAGDLKAVLDAGGLEAESLRPIERSLNAYRQALAARSDVVLLEPNPRNARIIRLFLEGSGLSVVDAHDVDAVREEVSEIPPMAVLLSLDPSGALDLIAQLHAADPDLEILASGQADDLNQALSAVAAGACDYVLGPTEGVELLGARVKRAVARARRRRLFNKLVTLLRDAAGTASPLQEVFAGLPAAAPEPAAPPTASPVATAAETSTVVLEIEDGDVEIEVDFSDVFDPLLHSDWDSAVGTGPMGTADAAVGLDVKPTSVEEQVAWGLDGVDPNRQVQLRLKELLFIGATLRELLRFLHDPTHYADPKDSRAVPGRSREGRDLHPLDRLVQGGAAEPARGHPTRPGEGPVRPPATALLHGEEVASLPPPGVLVPAHRPARPKFRYLNSRGQARAVAEATISG